MTTIVKTIAGSHLFGLNTPKSDLDYKGVFQESLHNIILGRDAKNINSSTNNSDTRNSSEDTDIELKELRTFIKDCIKGQTYAVEMLFCPEDKIIESSSTWDYIQENRHKLVPNDLSPFVGYCTSQAFKYGGRGIRLEELERVVAWFEQQPCKAKLLDCLPSLTLNEYTFILNNPKDRENDIKLSCLGLNFQLQKTIGECLPTLKKRLSQYGERSKLNKDNGGIDWKAYSHAFRLLYEWEQLLTEGKLTFPIPNRDFVLSVKAGQKPFDEIQDILFTEFDRINKIKNNLPEPDIQFWEDFVINQYLHK